MAGDGGIDQGSLARDMETSPATVVRNADVLGVERGLGLIVKTINSDDRKLRTLAITPKGQKFIEKLGAILR
jgi:DNA-binding MarR family transcriptional regulator